MTVGIIYKVHSAELLRAHSGERWCRNRPPSTPLPHPAASLCALSAHTLYKAGEVLTFPISRTKERCVRCEFTSNGQNFENFEPYICSVDRDCASDVTGEIPVFTDARVQYPHCPNLMVSIIIQYQRSSCQYIFKILFIFFIINIYIISEAVEN